MDAILTFHSLDDSGSVLSFPPARFETLLDGLLDEGTRFVAPGDLVSPDDQPGNRVALAFDDGIRSVADEALPRLSDRGVPATLYVVSDFVGRDNRWPTQPPDAPELELMDWEGLRDWTGAGLSIGCHTATHPRMDRVAGEDVWSRELDSARERLEDRLSVPVRSFAYPYGRVSDAAVAAVRSRFDDASTTRMGFVRRGDDAHLLPRIDSYYLRSFDGSLFGAGGRAYVSLRAFVRSLRWR